MVTQVVSATLTQVLDNCEPEVGLHPQYFTQKRSQSSLKFLLIKRDEMGIKKCPSASTHITWENEDPHLAPQTPATCLGGARCVNMKTEGTWTWKVEKVEVSKFNTCTEAPDLAQTCCLFSSSSLYPAVAQKEIVHEGTKNWLGQFSLSPPY